MIKLLSPDWPVPAQVKAYVTTRQGGVSRPPYEQLNLALHVGDEPSAVAQNRALLGQACGLPGEPFWLQQVHGCAVADAASDRPGCEADAVFSRTPGQVCAVLTADCLPLLISDRAGTQVAAVHAGWRGLAGGVVESAVSRFRGGPQELLVWLGPAIGPRAFEVGDDVYEAFVGQCRDDAEAFQRNAQGRWLADIYALARQRLARLGVGYVGGGEYCTWSQDSLFYSYRRDGVTGRMASLIWLALVGNETEL
jgi:YfiH family protein